MNTADKWLAVAGLALFAVAGVVGWRSGERAPVADTRVVAAPARSAADAVSTHGMVMNQDAAASLITLSERCPPSFEKTAQGTCELRDLYQFYDSLEGAGLGGTQTGLPPNRDGFTPAEIDLGRYLFFDPLLSGDGTLSCASCHRPEQGLSDGRPRSIGVHGQDVGRAAPTLWNVAFLKSFFWDARAGSLEAQAVGPLFSSKEMGNTPERLLAGLNGNADYRRLFADAFPALRGKPIALPQVERALAAFQSSLISLNSRYDRYAQGYHAALSEHEIEGLNVFRSFVARCAECHTPPLFTNQQVAVIGAPEPKGRPFDVGAEATFHAAKLKGGFKVPTLRNIARTAPYMHSGAFGTLRDTVVFYNKGRGNAVPKGMTLYLHWHIGSPHLTDYEVDRLVDFMQALTDETFMPEIPARVPSGLHPIDNPPQGAAATRTAMAQEKNTRGEFR
ncbi:MAG TPA: cytochrome c peroxidase [Steroidobacteraceae bacterium]|nr:cytochrome c peroxidase [Steroidobacteraceae bacterium]